MLNLRALNPPEWCNAGERRGDAIACTSAYITTAKGMVAQCMMRLSHTADECVASQPFTWCASSPPVLPTPPSPPPSPSPPPAVPPTLPTAIALRVAEINARFHTSPLHATWQADGLLPVAGVLVHCIDGWERGCDDEGCDGRWLPKSDLAASSLIFADNGWEGAQIPIFNEVCRGGICLATASLTMRHHLPYQYLYA